WVLPLAMLLDPAPADAPWLRGELDVAVFSQVLEGHEVGARGVASLLTADGILIARSDSGSRHAGLDAGGSPVFRALPASPGGLVEAGRRLDGISRVVGYQRGEGRPLVATVGMTPDALYGGWRAFAVALGVGMALLVGAWLLGMRFL